jgi:YVTN family beta-propeller protein
VDHDVAVLEEGAAPSYFSGLLNLCMAIGVNPEDGRVAVVGTDATNEVRFEPILRGRFLRVELALVEGGSLPESGLAPRSARKRVLDLNPHLDYACDQADWEVRNNSLGDPRGIAWSRDGKRAFVTGMGSNNLIVLDGAGNRVGAPIAVGEGPTGVVVHPETGAVCVLNRFEGSVSLVDPMKGRELDRVRLHDPSPAAIRIGRKHLYGTQATSGLGHVSCASCHVDARTDRLAWDLGDPAGDMKPVDHTNCGFGICTDHHPMKGPMLTQTLQDIVGKEPHHWRGDRAGLEEFAGAFETLLGDDESLSSAQMQELEGFLATIHFPPNPHRNLDNSLPERLPLSGHYTTGRFQPAGRPMPAGNARRGLELYRPPHLLDGVGCVTCHSLPTGLGADSLPALPSGYEPIPAGPSGERHHAKLVLLNLADSTIKIPHLRNLHERVGFNTTRVKNTIGFGYGHDGSVDSIERLLAQPRFAVESDQDIADLLAFLLSFSGSDLPGGGGDLEPPGTASQDTHAAVGRQTTLVDSERAGEAQRKLLGEMLALADTGAVGLVVKGRRDGEARGFAYIGGERFQSDRLSEEASAQELRSGAATGSELTWTLVPAGTELRIGIDRDGDGVFDRDELDAASDPASSASRPKD